MNTHNECRKCTKKDDRTELFFSIFQKRDFCLTCTAITLIDKKINLFGNRRDSGEYTIFSEKEITNLWNYLSNDGRSNLSNILRSTFSMYRSVEDMEAEFLSEREQTDFQVESDDDLANIEDGVNELELLENDQVEGNSEERLRGFYDGLSSHLNERLIGQEDLKRKILYVMTRFATRNVTKDPTIDISNLMIFGESGTGKTESIRATKEYFQKKSNIKELKAIPFIEVDASSLAPQSYKGLSVSEAIFNTALEKVGGNARLLEKIGCVVYLDEFDKLWMNNNEQKYAVGLEILRIIEGEDYSFTIRGPMGDKTVTVNTSNFIIIASGAFTKVFNAIKNKNKATMGKISLTDSESKESRLEGNDNLIDIDTEVTTKDLLTAGVPNEVLGRFPIKTRTHKLSEQNYYDILHVNNGVLEKGEKFLTNFGVEKKVNKELLRSFARSAAEGSLGARELKTKVEEEIEKMLYEEINKKESKEIKKVSNKEA